MVDYHHPFDHWNLRPVINVAGTKTSIGASRVNPDVIATVQAMLPAFVHIDELQAQASQVIAQITGAEAGCVTDCSAAGLCQSIAAALTGDDLGAIEKLPDCGTRQRRVAIPMGHMINYGGPIPQIIAMTGAEVVPVGTAAQCEVYHLRHELEIGCAAAVYVVSHHTVREGELPMSVFIELCKEYNTPVIVDMASEYDLTNPITLGADAVVYSGHKFMAGITSGIVAGTEAFIRSVYLQFRGIGRVMKVGKESIAGAMAALESWDTRDPDAIRRAELFIVNAWQSELGQLPGISARLHEDWTGNPITRIQLHVDPSAAKIYAWELADRLAGRSPSIAVRDDLVEDGEIYLDPCNVTPDEARAVSAAIVEEANKARNRGDGCVTSWDDVKRQRGITPLSWPSG